MLSGSGMLAYFHAGVVTALLEQDLLPDIISGSSGGAIVGSLVSTRPKDELNDYLNPKFLAEAMGQDRAGSSGARRSLKPRIVGIEDLIEMVETLIPDVTFQESLRLSGLNMNVSIAPAETHQKSRLLNAITSPNVLVRSAVIASTALPGFFPPATLVARDTLGDKKSYLASRRWVDGAISDDLPARRLFEQKQQM